CGVSVEPPTREAWPIRVECREGSDNGLAREEPEIMSRFQRRAGIGCLAGLFASMPLSLTLGSIAGAAALGTLIGGVFTLAFRPQKNAYVDGMMVGGSVGIPLWGFCSL